MILDAAFSEIFVLETRVGLNLNALTVTQVSDESECGFSKVNTFKFRFCKVNEFDFFLNKKIQPCFKHDVGSGDPLLLATMSVITLETPF